MIVIATALVAAVVVVVVAEVVVVNVAAGWIATVTVDEVYRGVDC